MAEDEKKKTTALLDEAYVAYRSRLYRWLYEHRGEVAAFAARPRPSWKGLADQLKAEGIETSRQAVMATWRRVERDLTAAKRAPAKAVRPAAQLTEPARAPDQEPDDGDDGFKFKRLKL